MEKNRQSWNLIYNDETGAEQTFTVTLRKGTAQLREDFIRMKFELTQAAAEILKTSEALNSRIRAAQSGTSEEVINESWVAEITKLKQDNEISLVRNNTLYIIKYMQLLCDTSHLTQAHKDLFYSEPTSDFFANQDLERGEEMMLYFLISNNLPREQN
jgi:hypothetical protein